MISKVIRTKFESSMFEDLSLRNSYRFYKHQIEELGKCNQEFRASLFNLDFRRFNDQIFRLTGGRMCFINEFINQAHQQGALINEPSQFDAIKKQIVFLENLRFEIYSKNDLRKVMRQLTSSKFGFIDLHSLRNDLRYQAIEALQNDRVIFHHGCSLGYSAISAVSKPMIEAMKIVLAQGF